MCRAPRVGAWSCVSVVSGRVASENACAVRCGAVQGALCLGAAIGDTPLSGSWGLGGGNFMEGGEAGFDQDLGLGPANGGWLRDLKNWLLLTPFHPRHCPDPRG